MVNPEDYDLVVLGSGEPGKFLAWTLAAEGRRVAVVERQYVGGSCPNVACLPSKNVIHSAKVASYARRGAEFGVAAWGGATDMAAVRDRKRTMVAGLVEFHLAKFAASGAELVLGAGTFVGPRTVEVALRGGGTRTLRGENVVVNTGSRATIDATPGLREAGPLTHVEALDLDRVPEHLVVLGGGPVGLELAQAFRRFGARVTVVERNAALLHREDADVSEAMATLFADEGIAVSAGTAVTRVTGTSGAAVQLHGTRGGVGVVIEGSHLLVAAGRTPNTDGIGLELAGVERDAHGYVKVDERLRTAAAGVWAVGDCAGSPQFTHIGFDDFRIVRDNLAGGHRVTTGRLVPSCLYIDPELARVGLSERQADARGIPYRLAKLPMAAVLRTWTLTEPRGFSKALVEKDGDRVLGFTAFGVGAGEVRPSSRWRWPRGCRTRPSATPSSRTRPSPRGWSASSRMSPPRHEVGDSDSGSESELPRCSASGRWCDPGRGGAPGATPNPSGRPQLVVTFEPESAARDLEPGLEAARRSAPVAKLRVGMSRRLTCLNTGSIWFDSGVRRGGSSR